MQTASLPELSSLAAASVTLRLVVSNATLQSISLPSGAGLVVRVRPNGGVDIGVLNDGSISLAISGTIDRIADNGRRTTVANIERATVLDVRPAEKNNPARIVLPPGAAPIAIYNQPIDSFRFGRARPTGDDPRTFQSEILDGEIQILDTGTSIELQPHELVLLEGGTRQLSRLEITDKSIAVDISGEADRISAGPPRTGVPFRLDRDLTPSVLSYLVGQHELKLLWGLRRGSAGSAVEGTPVGVGMGKIAAILAFSCLLLPAGVASVLAQALSEPEALARAGGLRTKSCVSSQNVPTEHQLAPASA